MAKGTSPYRPILTEPPARKLCPFPFRAALAASATKNGKWGRLSSPEAVRLAIQACEGLAYAHREGVVHCDLKPANILYDAQGNAKVADFGIAHVSDQMLSRSWMTSAGFIAGTLPYMSPEQTEGVRDDPRVDVYALGAVLYRALSGEPYLPFDMQDTPRAQADNVYRIYNVQPQLPSTLNANVPSWLDGIVLKALAKRREDRFDSMDQLRAALLQQTQVAAPAMAPDLAETLVAPPGDWPPAPSPEEGRRRPPIRFWPLVAGAVILLFVIGAAVWAALGGADGGLETATPDLALVGIPTATAPLPTQDVEPSLPPEKAQPTGISGPTDPPATALATETAQPATDTPQAAIEPSLSPSDTPQLPTDVPTDTPQPPTATLTDTPRPPTATPTNTPRPPTTIPTDTPRPPTVTPTLTPQSPTAIPTDTPVPAPRVYLNDQFNGSSLNGAIWQGYPNGGNVQVADGRLHLATAPGNTQFPYVHAKGNPFPQQGDFALRFSFAYGPPTWSGTGLVVGTKLPANASTDDPKNEPGVVLFPIWQDRGLGLAATYNGPARPENVIYQRGGTDESHHNGQIRYTAGAYQLWIDGQQVYQSPPTNTRPTTLWFGNPIVQDPSNPAVDLNWTGLYIDHVSIEELR